MQMSAGPDVLVTAKIISSLQRTPGVIVCEPLAPQQNKARFKSPQLFQFAPDQAHVQCLNLNLFFQHCILHWIMFMKHPLRQPECTFIHAKLLMFSKNVEELYVPGSPIKKKNTVWHDLHSILIKKNNVGKKYIQKRKKMIRRELTTTLEGVFYVFMHFNLSVFSPFLIYIYACLLSWKYSSNWKTLSRKFKNKY